MLIVTYVIINLPATRKYMPLLITCTEETNYRSSLSPFGIKMVDRLTGKPLHLDISDLPMKRGITTNRV